MSAPSASIRCREIGEDDFPALATLLVEGFGRRHSQAFWLAALDRLRHHGGVHGYPRYGYMLEMEGRAAGVLLMIFTAMGGPGEPPVRCNVSSWYVRPAARAYAPLLVSRALRFKDVQYLNITPAPETIAIIETQGYQPYAKGLYYGVGLWAEAVPGCRVLVADDTLKPGPDLSAREIRLLLDHAHLGCVSLVCVDEGRRIPFVFGGRRLKGVLPYGCLYWCRDIADFHAYVQPLARALARRGLVVLRIDANGPVASMPGRYFAVKPKYFRGPWKPRLGDLAYTELAVLGC